MNKKRKVLSAPRLQNSIFGYTNYKYCIKDWMKQNNISIRQLGDMLNIKSASYLHQLTCTKIKSGLSKLATLNLIKIMKLNKYETIFFKAMIIVQDSKLIDRTELLHIINATSFYLKDCK